MGKLEVVGEVSLTMSQGTCCDTTQALVFLLASVCCYTAEALVILLVSMCCSSPSLRVLVLVGVSVL